MILRKVTDDELGQPEERQSSTVGPPRPDRRPSAKVDMAYNLQPLEVYNCHIVSALAAQQTPVIQSASTGCLPRHDRYSTASIQTRSAS